MVEISDKTQNYLLMLEEKFDKDKFCEFIKDLLNLDSNNIINGKEQAAGSEQYQNYIDTAQLYAKYEDEKRRSIGIIIIKLKDNKNAANARTMQRNFIAHLLDYYNLDASLTAIYSNTEETWRLSFVKQEIEIEVGKLKTKVSPAKRYSYLFGKDEPNHTAKEQLLDLLENNNRKFSIEEIEDKFSVEKVTKDFFENYKENYLKLKETLENNEEFVSEANRCDFTSEEFTKKLMGQIVFIYFLQKKGWLGVNLVSSKLSLQEYQTLYNKEDVLGKKILEKYYISYDNGKIIKKELLERYKENEQEIDKLSDIFIKTNFDKEWGTGEKKFIRKIFENCKNRNKNFFDDYLEPFFYNGLNHKRHNQYFSVFNCKIPFLNGGLFEPLDNYNWEIAKFNIDNNIFSNSNNDGILDFFDRYNFTMNEEEPLEKDVAVDPEMLGKIFENLLDVKDRKSKGAFYTPREIVHYMCQESIANFLVNKVNVDYDEIKEFIQYGEMIRDVDLKEATRTTHLLGNTIFDNILAIDKALENIKIADPAVGSGAFPLGMLNEIVKIRDILTSYIIIYNKLGMFERKFSEASIVNKRNIYKIKWNTIRNSIYAVDIENSAVDITKLRLWLSIVVDQVEVPDAGPEPLPNLDCKIMQGNSLIDEYKGIKLIDPKFIDELKDRNNVKFNDGGKVKEKGRLVTISENQIQFGDGQKKVQIDDLIRLKQELYETNEPTRKKELLKKIQNTRKELLKLNFQGTNNEQELFAIDNSHSKPYFAWMLEFIEVFIENNGFDIVIGNPPYGLINKKQNQQETIKMTEEQMNYIKNSKEYESAKGGLLNIFRLFICKSHYLLKDKGNMSLIFPMAFMCDLSASKLRKFILENDTINFIEAFPERDNENTRVFRAAKMSVCILQCQRGINILNKNDFFVRTHWNKYVDLNNEKVIMNKNIISKIDENNLTIPLINNYELNIIEKILNNSEKMETYSKCYEGEVNLTFHKEYIYNTPLNHEKLIRGAQVQRYLVTNNVSQGEILYLDKENYLSAVTSEKSKHYKNRRLIMQGITGINEKYRLKMAIIENSEFCANSANYIIENNKASIEYVLAVLNSKLMNWYFKKLSTNSNVNGYEIDNLPLKISKDDESTLTNLVKEYMKKKKEVNDKEDIEYYEKKINEIVYNIYNLDNREIRYIEES